MPCEFVNDGGKSARCGPCAGEDCVEGFGEDHFLAEAPVVGGGNFGEAFEDGGAWGGGAGGGGGDG